MCECHVADIGTPNETSRTESAFSIGARKRPHAGRSSLTSPVCAGARQRGRRGHSAARTGSLPYLLLGFCVPVVAGCSSGTQVIALRSYLKPLAFLRVSLLAFMTRYHLLLFLFVAWTALKGTATSFSPIPRKPPTPTMSAVALPSRSTSTSMISPILLSLGS